MHRMKVAAAMAVAGGLACLGIVALAGRAKSTPNAATPAAATNATPRGEVGVRRDAQPAAATDSELACAAPHVDVGETAKRRQVHEFELTNRSGERMRITATEKSCGCVKREFSKYELAAGETTKLTLDFPIRTAEGTVAGFLERLEVYVDDRNERPAAVLSVGGTYVPLAYRVGDGIHIELPASGETAFQGSIEVRLNTSRGVRIVGFKPAGMLPLEARVVPGEPMPGGQEQRFTIEVTGTLPPDTALPATGAVVARLNSDEMPELAIPVVLYKQPGNEVRTSPERLAFGVLESGASAMRAVVIVFPDGSDYVVERAEPSGDGVRVRVETRRGGKRGALLRCELDTSTLRGALKQDLVITMTSPGKPRETRKVPMSAYVKPAAAEQAAGTSLSD
ncbi:MAG TPA: DUF1573 domain-containing protein [Pirellulales bacterium]|nr:DUF1573 domain-containing protein [Pirellulales bacterium]